MKTPDRFIEQVYKKPTSSNNRMVFLDRDGVLIKDPEYLRNVEQIEVLSGVIEGLKLFQNHNFLLVVITNQPVIAKGYITISELKKINDYITSIFLQQSIVINAIYSCPHHPNADITKYRKICKCRKPGIAMFEKATKTFSTELKNSYMIGDHTRDIEAGQKFGIKSFLLTKKVHKSIGPKFQNSNFLQVAKQIVKQIS